MRSGAFVLTVMVLPAQCVSAEHRALVVYAWNGRGRPLELVRQDQFPAFDVLLFDYSGTVSRPTAAGFPLLSRATECKGEIYREIQRHLAACPDRYDYVGLIDDDIALAWSDLNRLLAIAAEHRLDAFQPALTPDSHHDHALMLARPGSLLRWRTWVEVMMPFYRVPLFLAGEAYYARSISSYGIDQFVMPALQKLTGMERVAIVDAVALRHTRPITSDGKVFANGLSARQERQLQWRLARAQVARDRPDLVGSPWYFDTFARWDGPLRFLVLRLIQPLLSLRRRAAGRSNRRCIKS